MKKSTTIFPFAIIFRLSLIVSLLLFSSQSQRAESQEQDLYGETHITVSDQQTKSTGYRPLREIYRFKARGLDGSEIDFKQYQGDVLLIVNTASECTFTPQYAGLEALHKKYEARGLKILGFPCNQFAGQEPGDADRIADFCQIKYGVEFQMFDKIDVNGKNAHPLYKYLTQAAPGVLGSKAIKWNFTKFLIDREGKIIARYAPNVKPEDIAPTIKELL